MDSNGALIMDDLIMKQLQQVKFAQHNQFNEISL